MLCIDVLFVLRDTFSVLSMLVYCCCIEVLSVLRSTLFVLNTFLLLFCVLI